MMSFGPTDGAEPDGGGRTEVEACAVPLRGLLTPFAGIGWEWAEDVGVTAGAMACEAGKAGRSGKVEQGRVSRARGQALGCCVCAEAAAESLASPILCTYSA